MIDRLGLQTGMAMLRPLWSVDGSFRQSRKFALLLMKTKVSSRGARLTLDQPVPELARHESTIAGGWRLNSGDPVDLLILCVLA